jgi:TP53 regulating kinase-like protein
VSAKIEDKAVDLQVMKRALVSSHPGSEGFFELILEKYRDRVVGWN